MKLFDYIIIIVLGMNFGAMVYGIVDILMKKNKDRTSVSIGWVWIVIFFQGPGALLYFIFNQER